jgi:hypothetical protein
MKVELAAAPDIRSPDQPTASEATSMQTQTMRIPVESLAERVRHERCEEQEQAPDNRRRDPRFVVPGTLVRVPCRPFSVAGAELETREVPFGVLPAFWSQRRQVINVSKGGLAFESHWPVARGRRLRMQLWVPGEQQPLELTGETRWCKRLLGDLYHVGVQFDSFGARPGMNAPAMLAALRMLERKYV